MQNIYVRAPNLYIVIDNAKISAIEINTVREINRFAVKVDGLGATPSSNWEIRDNILYLDGLMIVELLGWLRGQYPKATIATFGKRFFDLFRDGDTSLLLETIKAVARVTLNRSADAAGEDAMFVATQWRQHLEEFAELLSAYLSDDG